MPDTIKWEDHALEIAWAILDDMGPTGRSPANDVELVMGHLRRLLTTALAQAERERDGKALYMDLARSIIARLLEIDVKCAPQGDIRLRLEALIHERDTARAEVERLMIENDAARKSIGEAWDTAVADGAKIRALEAEVERLKGELTEAQRLHGEAFRIGIQHQDRANQAEADLARVREILTGACARYDHWYVNGASAEAENMAYELVSAIRAALEGR